jgi:hypothetical protein
MGCNPGVYCPFYTIEMGALNAYVINEVPCPPQMFGVQLQKGLNGSPIPHPSPSPRPSGCVKYVGTAYYSSANCSVTVPGYHASRASAAALAPPENDVLEVFIKTGSNECGDGPGLMFMWKFGLVLIILGGAFPFVIVAICVHYMAWQPLWQSCKSCKSCKPREKATALQGVCV